MEDGQHKDLQNNLLNRVDRLALYKKYSHTAHKTLTNFTNEISEILRQSIERMDTICLKVRGCVNDFPEHPKRTASNVYIPLNTSDPTETTLYPRKFMVLPIKSEILGASSAPEPLKPEEPRQRRKTKRKVKKRAASISFATIRNRSNFQTPLSNVKEEQSVIAKIKQHYEELDPVQRELRKKYVTRTRTHRLKKPSVSADVFHMKAKRSVQSKRINECYTKEDFDDNLWFGPRLIAQEPQAGRKRATKLSRKYANENFQQNAYKERPIVVDDVYNGKKLKLQSDNNKDWSLMMHTHRPTTRYELKQNSTLRVNTILDEITLKDLEPLKAEYPRKDNQQLPDIPLEQSLLYKLVNEDLRSLEYLIDVANVPTVASAPGPKAIRKSRRRGFRLFELHQTIPEEEAPSAGDAKQQRKKSKRRGGKKPQNEIVVEEVKADKRAVNLKDYQAYRRVARRRLNKYLVNPNDVQEKRYIVMPVQVEYDKDREASRLLASYIYGGDRCVKIDGDATVMMMHSQPPKERPPRNYKFQSNKLTMGNTDQSSILIQKVVDCKQVNKPVPKHQQLISYIVNKQQNQKQRGNPAGCTESAQRIHGVAETPRGKERQRRSTGEIRSLIKGVEQQVQEVTEQTPHGRKLLIGKLQNDIKTILSDMQLDNESIEFSVTSSESLVEPKPSLPPQKQNNYSKSETTAALPARRGIAVKKRAATTEKGDRKPITLAMPPERYKKFIGFTSAKQQWVEHVAEFTKNISMNDIVVTRNPPDIQVIYPEKPNSERLRVATDDVDRFKERFDSIMKEVEKLKQGNPNFGMHQAPVLKHTTSLPQNPTSNQNPSLHFSASARQKPVLGGSGLLLQSPEPKKQIHGAKKQSPEHRKQSSEPTKQSHEPTKQSPEPAKQSHEPAKQSHEPTKQSHEPIKQNHESTKQSHELTKQSHESVKQSHEPIKQSHESTKQSHELTKQSHESVKQNHELTKQSHESIKQNHESAKQSQELTKKIHESTKQSHERTKQSHEPAKQVAPHRRESSPKRYKLKSEGIGLDRLPKDEQEKRGELTKRILGKWLALENPSITEIGNPRRKVQQKILREVRMQTILGTADKATGALVSAPMEAKIERFEHELGEETNKFCQELHGVMAKIQDKSWTPYQPEVRQSNFSNILVGLGSLRDSIKRRLISHQAKVKHIASEHYIKSNLEQIEKQEPPENIYEELLGEASQSEPLREVDVDFVDVEFNVGDLVNGILGSSNEKASMDVPVIEEEKTDASVVAESPVIGEERLVRDHKKFLTVFYGVVFAMVFCGLNFKYSCV